MATIKFKRGSGVPIGLTAYEAAWDTSLGRFFIHNGSTATWIGARIDDSITLGGAGVCAYYLPTQLAVKTYVDNQVAGGAVSSINGITGAVNFYAGSGLSISSSSSLKGITYTNTGVLSIDGSTGAITNVARTNTTNSFSALQTLSQGLVVSGGMTLADTLRLRGSITDPGGKIELWNEDNTFKFTLQPEATTSKDGLFQFGGADGFVVAADSDGATSGWIVKANGAGASPTWINPAAVGFSAYQSDRTDRLLIADASGGTYYLDLSGGKTGYQLHYSSNNITWNETSSRFTAPNFVATNGLTAGNITFTGTLSGNVVSGITGTVNQITVSGNTGSVTLSLPSAITVPGSLTTTTTLSVGTDLTVTGNLTVNGTTTTVNSTTVTVQDPIIAIGGVTGNAAPPNGDTKDRGIVFQWNNGSAGQTGFFGFDQSTQRFTFLPQSVTVSGEVVSGNAGNAEFAGVLAPQGTLTLTGVSAANATITLAGATVAASTSITNNAFDTVLTSSTGTGRLSLLDSTFKGTVVPTTLTAARTYTLPNHSGVVAAPTDLGTLNFVLTSQGSTAQPIWVNPATGLTANNANNILTVSDTSDAVCFVTFVNTGTNGMQSLKYNPGFTYNAVTNYLEVNIDGGAY